eukprot:gene25670-11336_t
MDCLPFEAKPHDALREGLASLKEDVSVRHPVEEIQMHYKSQNAATSFQMLKGVYGVAMPAKLEIERQILGKFGRLPGIPSSNLALESMTGELDDFAFESYLGLPEFSEMPQPDAHSQMEQKLGMSTAKVTRGFS